MKIVWSPLAKADRHRIWMFAAEHDVGWADRIDARLKSRVGLLGDIPLQGPPIAHGARRLSIPDIQLVLNYRIVEGEDAIRILRIWSTRQNRGEP